MNIELSKELTVFNKEKYHPKSLFPLKCNLKQYIRNNLEKMKISESVIRNVKIIKIDKTTFSGEVKIIYNDLFDISFTENVFSGFIKNNEKEKNIILHELYHIEDMIILNKITNIYDMIDKGKKCTSTRELLIGMAIHEFGEYYAYHNIPEFDITKEGFEKSVYEADVNLTAMKLFGIDHNVMKLPESAKIELWNFISKNIIICANDNKSNGIFEEFYDNLKIKYIGLYEYARSINLFMTSELENYHKNANEEFYLKVGKKLVSLFNKYGLNFGASDYSDNFEIHKLI